MASPQWPAGGIDPVIEDLQERYLPEIARYDVAGLLAAPQLGRRAIVSSFGAESVVLLHYVTVHVPDIPVIFIDTLKHFPETLAYRDKVAELLNLNLLNIEPSATLLAKEDPDGQLHGVEPGACCTIRKVFPLQDALQDFDSWISGRKRFQSSSRSTIPLIERDGEKIKVNPLALWDKAMVEAYFEEHELPRHPLPAQGYASIGCAPCTRPVRAGEDLRAGRWADSPDKSECGIHLGPDGRFVRHGHKN